MTTHLMTLILNIIGLCMSFIGTLLMFSANPKVEVGGRFFDEEDFKEVVTQTRTKRLRGGMLILSFGFLFQLIAIVVSMF